MLRSYWAGDDDPGPARMPIETIRTCAEVTIQSILSDHPGVRETATVAVETVIGSGNPQDTLDLVMLLAGVARRCLEPRPPFVYDWMHLDAPGLDRRSDVDDIVLTILSRAFGGRPMADVEGVQLAIADAVARDELLLVVLRLAAVSAGRAILHKIRQPEN